jgi:23S rRNA pseudouridine1911/1915/1917 synthase
MTTQMKQFFVTESLASKRLDAVLVAALENEYSRTAMAERIKAGNVTVDDKVIKKPSHIVLEGQSVTVNIPPPPVFAVVPTPVDFEVVAEEKDFIIVNKPAGLSVHHSSTAPEDITLVHGLLHRFPEFADFDDYERPGIVHRLDKDTTGLLVIARNAPALSRLSALFKERTISKTYYALVHGHPQREGVIDKPIGRHPTLRHKMGVHGVNSRDSVTKYRVVTYFEGPFALLEITLITGRTHQIRVHCASEGFPLVGDFLYGRTSPRLARQALHASKLAFAYQGKQYAYERPVPNDMAQLIARLEPIATEEVL